MIGNYFENFKTQQEELHKRAEMYRLVKSLEKSSNRLDRLYTVVGRALIVVGQHLLNRTQAAH